METIVNNKENLNSRLAFYTLAAGAFSVGAQAAPTPSTTAAGISAEALTDGGPTVVVPVDIDGDGTDDFELRVFFNTKCTYNDGGVYLESGAGSPTFFHDGTQYAGNVSPGTVVPDALGGTTSGFVYLAGCSNGPGNFPADTRGFLGMQFMIGANMHNAYLDVGVAAGSLVGTVYGACYESTPGAPITVGACAAAQAIPVGGLIPMTLGVLALGATAALRRRRKQLN